MYFMYSKYFSATLINYKFLAGELLNETEENARNEAKITAKEMDKWLSIQKKLP